MSSHTEDSNAAGAESYPPEPNFDLLSSEAKSWILETAQHRDQASIRVQSDHAFKILEQIHDVNPHVVLTDVTAVDYLEKDTPERFLVVYVLQDRRTARYFRVEAWLSEEKSKIRSAFPLWKLAKWGERECHDMFGIEFDGNPDLRRFLMPQDYPGFPLLKDYPLKGHGERAQFPKVVPEGDLMQQTTAQTYPVTVGRDLHTPEYLEAMREKARPRRKDGEDK